MFGFLSNVFSNGERILSETRVIAGSRKNVSTWTFAFGGAELRILRWHLISSEMKYSPPFPFLCKLCSYKLMTHINWDLVAYLNF